MSYKVCSIEGCGNEKVIARGLCSKHYTQLRRREGLKPGRKCTEEGCSRVQESTGLCTKHYSKVRIRLGLPGAVMCRQEGCDRPGVAKGVCYGHYQQAYMGLELGPLPESGEYRETTPGRWRSWKVNKEGYIYRDRRIEGRNESQLQHRYVMSEHLGRELEEFENVHHLNGVRHDNRLENLELWIVSQPSGQRVADRIRDALWVLEKYGTEPGEYEGHLEGATRPKVSRETPQFQSKSQ